MSQEEFEHKAGPGTLAVWAGEEGGGWERSTQIPVVHSVSFGYDDLDTWQAVALGKESGHIYSRNTNPTVAAFEEKIRRLEDAEAATSFATGMAAISNTLHTLLKPGDRVVSVKDTYGGSNQIFAEFLPRLNIDVVLCDTTDFDAIEAEIANGLHRALHGEPDQSHAQDHGHSAAGRGRTQRRRHRHRRQHLCHTHQHQPTDTGR